MYVPVCEVQDIKKGGGNEGRREVCLEGEWLGLSESPEVVDRSRFALKLEVLYYICQRRALASGSCLTYHSHLSVRKHISFD